MANLRDMLDGRTLHTVDAAASPIANHVSDHMADPIGKTKPNFSKLTKAKLDYDQAREETQRSLSPVQSVINHLSQMHNLNPNQDNNMPMDPGMDPNNPNGNQLQDEEGNPIETGSTTGKMNQTRPSLVGNQPGVAPGDGQTVRPPKLGQAKPGGPGASNSPNPGNAQGNSFAKTAAKPKGNGKLPGAKGPGDPKNVSKNKKAQAGTTGRQIKVNVSAALDMQASASYSNVESSLALGSLKTSSPAIPVGTVLAKGDIGYNELRDLLQQAMNKKYGKKRSDCNSCASVGAPWISDVFPMDDYFIYTDNGKTFKQEYTLEDNDVALVGDPEKVKISYVAAARQLRAKMGMSNVRLNAKKLKAGPAALADKVTDNTGDEVAYNPKISAGGPGSGRRPGSGSQKLNVKPNFNSGKQRTAHKMLTKAGFTFKKIDKDVEGNIRNVYSHPDAYDKLAVHDNGSWNHGIGGAGGFSKLKSHLSDYNDN